MFIPMWLIFLLTGLIMAVFAVVWGIGTNQFEDQDRARFIPLAGMTSDEVAVKRTKKFRAEYAGLYAMLTVGILALGAGLVLALRHL